MSDKALLELSRFFAMNAICHSVNHNDEIRQVADKLLMSGMPVKKYQTSRNILIIGAGVSKNASENIPLATEFAKLIEGKIKASFTEDPEQLRSPLDTQFDYLTRAYNLQRNEFETIMLACSRINNTLVLKELKEKYDIKHVPNLFFEIVGHLFKHRFIDVIINFNFDEILDSVIEEEMSGLEYHSIISDGDLSDELEDLMYGHRLKKPMYIKPHGTISHPSTMRFNKEHYFALPSNIADLIKTLFIGGYSDGNNELMNERKPDKFLKLNLLIAGFGMQSNDLNYLINEALKERKKVEEKNKPAVKIFVFDKFSNQKDQKAGDYLNNLQKTGLFEGIEDHFFIKKKFRRDIYFEIPVSVDNRKINTSFPKDKNNLEQIFYQLFNKIQNRFKPTIELRSIARHLVIAEIFQKKRKEEPLKIFRSKDDIEDANKSKSECYLIARIFVELAILLVQSEGVINITQLQQSRFNKYFLLLQRLYSVFDNSKGTLKPVVSEKKALLDFIEAFGMRQYKFFAKDTFVYELEAGIGHIKSIAVRLMKVLNDLKKSFPLENVLDFNTGIQNILEDHFSKLNDNPHWEIKPNFKEYSIPKFKTISDKSFLHTDLRFTRYRNDFFDKKDWNIVLSITKRAHFLKELPKKSFQKNQKMFLVTADLQEKAFYEDNFRALSKKISITSEKLHWALHNQHLHLFISRNKEKLSSIPENKYFIKKIKNKKLSRINEHLNSLIKFKRGIYFQRRMLSRKSNPVYFDIDRVGNKSLSVEDDLVELFDVFVNYWARIKYQSFHSIIEFQDFVEAKADLLRLMHGDINAAKANS